MLLIILIPFITAITILTISIATINSYNKKLSHLQYQLESLNTQITIKKQELTTVSNPTFSPLENQVLDYYQSYNIHLPSDILEELYHAHLTTSSDMFDFIEHHRHSWKLECTKKIPKKRTI